MKLFTPFSLDDITAIVPDFVRIAEETFRYATKDKAKAETALEEAKADKKEAERKLRAATKVRKAHGG